jgi:ABC-type Fe3+-hydroxamate transport system substrate-binding protein
MAKFASNTFLDGAFNVLKNSCTRLVACSAQPTTYTEANATYALADVTVDSADFTIADGDTSGRKVTVAAQTGVTVDTAGTANHIALLDVAGTELLYVTTCTPQALAVGIPADFGAFDIEIGDPT